MSSKNAPTASAPATAKLIVVKPKLSDLDRQQIALLAGMAQTIKSVIGAIKSGDVREFERTSNFLEIQWELNERLNEFAERSVQPTVNSPSVSADL